MKNCRKPEIIVALDVDTVDQALDLVQHLGDAVGWYKIGKQIFTRHGPGIVRELNSAGKKVFLDLKYHDIPNTVAQAVRSAGSIGADMVNVHASGGPAMLKAAAEAALEAEVTLVAVTVLTSLDKRQLAATGIKDSPEEQVVRLARLTRDSGANGVVCSALEIAPIRKACGEDFLLVVPGIRPAGTSHGDQKRVMTPAQAASAGADYLVIGRPIREAPNPYKAAKSILAELD